MAEDDKLVVEIQSLTNRLGDARASVERRFVGQHAVVEQVLSAILSGGHALLEVATGRGSRPAGHRQALVRAGWFDDIAGIALGSWRDCGPPEQIRALMVETLGPLGVPLAADLGFGHGPAAHSLPLGVPVTLAAPPEGTPSLCAG